MDRAGTHIADESRPAVGDFVLDIQIPIQNIRAVRVRIDHAIADSLAVKVDVGVGSACAQGGSMISSNDLKRRGGCGIETKFVGKGQHIKDAEAGPDGGFSVFARIPGDANARLEVLIRRVVGDWAVRAHWTACCGPGGAIRKGLDLLEAGSSHGVTIDGVTR